MKNELRAIAENYYAEKAAAKKRAVAEHVEKRVLPELKKRAAAGFYSYRIEEYSRGCSDKEVAAVLAGMGLEIKPRGCRLYANW